LDYMVGLFESNGEVDELELVEELEEHLVERAVYGKHRVSLGEVLEVRSVAPKYFANAGSGHRAPVVMVGPTRKGRMLCVPIEPSGRRGLWRPVTAFEANTHHRDRYSSS
jgi:hypothetical protein